MGGADARSSALARSDIRSDPFCSRRCRLDAFGYSAISPALSLKIVHGLDKLQCSALLETSDERAAGLLALRAVAPP